jgi:phage portal protein BeeE
VAGRAARPYRGSNDGAVNGGVIGISPIDQNRETVALAIAAERFAGSFFANGARPSVVIEMDKKLPNDRSRSASARAWSAPTRASTTPSRSPSSSSA